VTAVAAILGGVLRVTDSYLAETRAVAVQQIAYFVTDLMLSLGLCGIYFARRKVLGLAGLLGFVTSIVGLLIVRSSGLNVLGPNSYVVGATVTLVGVVALGFDLLLRAAFPKLGPTLWITSFAVGLIGLLTGMTGWIVVLAGVIFGVGFVAAGVSLLQEGSQAQSE